MIDKSEFPTLIYWAHSFIKGGWFDDWSAQGTSWKRIFFCIIMNDAVLLSIVSSQPWKSSPRVAQYHFFFELVALWLVGESFWVIRLLELSVFYLKFISGPMIFKVDKRLCWEELRRSLWDAKIILLSDRALCWSIVKLSPIDEWMSPVNYSRKLTFAYYILDITSSIDFSLKNSCDVVLCWWQPWNNWSQELPEPRYSKLIVQIDDQNRK